MSFFGYVFGPKLNKVYGDGPLQKMYEPTGMEKWGDQLISTLSIMWNFSYYTSPILMTFLYRRGYFIAETVTAIAKLTTGFGILIVISLWMRGFGRQKSQSYQKLVKALDNLKAAANNEQCQHLKNGLQSFDFDFKSWPIDFDVNSLEDDKMKKKLTTNMTISKNPRQKKFWTSTLPCEIAAYIAIHTFGLKMIYPGSLKLLQSYFNPMLVQGRSKLIEQDKGKRSKIKTRDGNEIDSIFVDKRNSNLNGKTLVICSEGNAGFYEIGIMATPLSLNYSVLGWNHPGFASSSGTPFPSQDQNAIDGVLQFAIHKLGFLPENIILFGWSIGAYTSLWAGSQYPEIKGIILDATFDDILYLALPRMPESISGIVKIAIREYVNLNNIELINAYPGPVFMIRRTDDEVICIEENKIETNRGNFLLLAFLKHRYPYIFGKNQYNYARELISKPVNRKIGGDDYCLSLITSYVSDNSKSFPMLIGEDYSDDQKNHMVEFLIRKHFRDYKSTHCTPLPGDYFNMPWDIPTENDFVFT